MAALATTAGIAVENARLYEESRRRQEWLVASAEVSQRLLAATADADEVWRLITADVRHLADADVVTVVVPSERDPTRLVVAVATGTDATPAEGTDPGTQERLGRLAMEQGRAVVVGGAEELRQLGLPPSAGVGPAMALPLKGELGSRGAVVVCRLPGQRAFTLADVAMAEDFARQAAIALELADARTAQQRLGALEDRERIALDLHDHVIQRLFATGLSLQSTAGAVVDPVARERLHRTVADLDETIRQIRMSIFALKYSRPALASVRATVLSVVEELTPALGFRPGTHFAGPLDTVADEDLAGDVAAVLREALTNVARHARASSVAVSVEVRERHLRVAVVDDGRGLRGRPRRSGGLDNLRQRAERHSGELVLDRPAGQGLRLVWSVPVA